MAFLGVLKNAFVTKATEEAKFVGAYSRATAKAITSESSSKLKGATLTTGNLVVLTVLKAGAGLAVGRPYYVIEASGEKFGVSQTSGGPAETWTTEVEATTEIAVLTEVVYGGGGKRIATSWGSVAKSFVEDVTGHALKIPAAGQVDYLSYHTAESAGTLEATSEVTKETFAAEGTYTATSSTFSLLGVA